jgi:hypothetical protein
VIRQQYAFGLLAAADLAAEQGVRSILALELGVAEGAGLLNLSELADHTTQATGVQISVVGFDGGFGLPKPIDYRDHPERFGAGDFPMLDEPTLRSRLPAHADLVVGSLADTIPALLGRVSPERPIGFIAFDLDYFSSTQDAMALLQGPPEHYLPAVPTYFDDIDGPYTNPWVGELAAISAFNDEQEFRKIAPWPSLRPERICKNALWLDKMYLTQVLDHPRRQPNTAAVRPQQRLPYR